MKYFAASVYLITLLACAPIFVILLAAPFHLPLYDGLIWVAFFIAPTLVLILALPISYYHWRRSQKLSLLLKLVFAVLTVVSVPAVLMLSIASETMAAIAFVEVVILLSVSATLFTVTIRSRAVNRFIAMPLVLIAFGLSLWAVMSPIAMIAQAKLLADGRPYCIGIGYGFSKYFPYSDLLSLHGFVLAAPDGTFAGGSSNLQFIFHAILDIEGSEKRYNWSKAKYKFEEIFKPELFYPQSLRCEKN